MPIIRSLGVVGAFGRNNSISDVWGLLLFGVLGYALEKFGYPLSPLILGFILGPMAETNLRRGLMHTQGAFLPFLQQPIAVLFFLMTAVSVGLIAYQQCKNSKN